MSDPRDLNVAESEILVSGLAGSGSALVLSAPISFWGGIDPATGAFEHTPIPGPVTTNICFGGADMRDACVTCSSTGKLYKCRWPRPGHKLAFNG